LEGSIFTQSPVSRLQFGRRSAALSATLLGSKYLHFRLYNVAVPLFRNVSDTRQASAKIAEFSNKLKGFFDYYGWEIQRV